MAEAQENVIKLKIEVDGRRLVLMVFGYGWEEMEDAPSFKSLSA
jgi:hypothetical protein